MKKGMIFLIALLLFAGGFPVLVTHARQPEPIQKESAEQGWMNALKTKVAIAEAKVALLEAQSAIWLAEKKTASLESLETALASLNKAYKTADKTTRKQIVALNQKIQTTKKKVRQKGVAAGAEVAALAGECEQLMTSAYAEAAARSAALKKMLSTQLALAQAKAAALKARIALEIEKSPDKARKAVEETEQYLESAKITASDKTWQEIAALEERARSARRDISGKAGNAVSSINKLISASEKTLKDYGTKIGESEEASLLKRRYAQLQAKASLMKANLAAKTEATYDQAQAYLDEAKVWYARAKEDTREEVGSGMATIEKHIDSAKLALKKKAKDARQDIANLLNRAAAIIEEKE